MLDDLFDQSKPSKDAFEDMTEAKPRSTFKPKKESYWDKEDISPLEIDVSKFKRKGKSFAIYVYPENDIPDEAAAKIKAFALGLMSNGFVLRHTGGKNNVLQTSIISSEGAVFDSYLPWKGINPDVSNPILPTPEGYKVSVGIHKSYMKLPPTVRAICARDVNTLTGADLTDPVDFVIAWTDGGAEALIKDSDFKKIGFNSFMLQVAKRGNIPVINVYNDNCVEKLKSFSE